MAFKQASRRDTWAEVRLDCIKYNIRMTLQQFHSDVSLMAMVKADGYGHGAVETAKAAIEAGAEFLGVALLDEALELRDEGIEAPILVLGRTNPEDALIAAQKDIRLTAFQKEWLEEAESYIKGTARLNVHIKVDTGMGRFGMAEEEEIEEFMGVLRHCCSLHPEGLYTHFATADSKKTEFFERQYSCFLDNIRLVKDHIGEVEYIHCGNSAASLRFPERCFNMVRIGISMYGLPPSKEIIDDIPFTLQPAFSLHSRIVQIKEVPQGQNIGYGQAYITTEKEWIATIPIGYADGWYRQHASKGAEVLVDGVRVPIVGRICMDQLMVRLPEYRPVGTKVTMVGSQNQETISAVEVAERLDTIPYEIPCMISKRVPRIYVS
ncbi:alanine racemase [Alteribacillus iranensis]|uniref:Alanine racemase n=1 Tax=Alteribacillus iranensis TaxID=930128 RepID=A0A1I2DEN8_9BACI|nr:alanine racemase [Alteribacillus iranensis]SFE78974.1 alanine racemase [Alteribacillus iranensis]